MHYRHGSVVRADAFENPLRQQRVLGAQPCQYCLSARDWPSWHVLRNLEVDVRGPCCPDDFC